MDLFRGPDISAGRPHDMTVWQDLISHLVWERPRIPPGGTGERGWGEGRPVVTSFSLLPLLLRPG